MAFTENLPGVQNQVGVIDPGPRGPTFLQTAANIGSNAIQLAGTMRAGAQRREAAASDETISGLASAVLRERGNRIISQKEAVAQGRSSQTRLDNEVERYISYVEANRPQDLPAVIDFLRIQGVEHLYLEGETIAQQQETAFRNAQLAQDVANFDMASNYLGNDAVDRPRDQIVGIGRAMRSAQEERNEILAQLDADQQINAHEQTQLRNQLIRIHIGIASAIIEPDLNEIESMLRAGTLNGAEAQARIAEIQDRITRERQEARGRALEDGLDPEHLETVEQIFEDYSTGVQRTFETDNARTATTRLLSETNLRILDLNPFLVNVYAMGGDAAAETFLRVMTEDDRMFNAVASALNMESVAGPTSRTRQTMADVENFVTSNVNDARPEVRERFGEAFVTRLDIAADMITGGREGSSRQILPEGGINMGRGQETGDRALAVSRSLFTNEFTNQYSGFLEYALNEELVRGQINGLKMENMASQLFGLTRANALREADDPALTMQSIETAQRYLDRVADYGPLNPLRQMFGDEIRFDSATGMFRTHSPRRALNAARREAGVEPGWPVDVDPSVTMDSPDRDLGRMVTGANRVLDFLMHIEDMDERLTGLNMTDVQLRNFYVTGTLPEGMEMRQPSLDPAPAQMDPYLERLAFVESSNDPNAQASTSSAAGLFQFTDAKWREIAPRVPELADRINDEDFMDLRLDPELATAAARVSAESDARLLRERLEREPTAGELYAAHFLGRQGALQLLSALETNPTGSAAETRPAAARANPNVFYKDPRTRQRPRTNRELMAWLENRMQG